MNNETKVKVVTADPSALGLFGLAMITLVASSQKLGLTSNVSLFCFKITIFALYNERSPVVE